MQREISLPEVYGISVPVSRLRNRGLC